ncbi:DUF485 domain-containing protein [Galactobacter valiniphilus]|uniref:DUF485 domain-containing protein n=1 Tax=Galactobacter valiniphilus TaxID=2676122 RepID=A0A399JB14_9MICC|nr:DUF485 domain-containing protein [Galactobacter valiniphilus]RII41212.1 DUF485 domain-containing protein [Galactobacter valiniphilus]
MSDSPTPAPEDFLRVQQEPRFRKLRSDYRRFAFPMTALFLAWYLLYVIVAAFFPQVMAVRVYGYVNVGIVWGLLQFVSTFVITALYVRFANRKLDPEATAIRQELEADAERNAAAQAGAKHAAPAATQEEAK